MSNNYYDLYLWNPVIPECINAMVHVFRLMCIVLVYLAKNLPTNVAFLLICFMSFCLYQMTLNGLLELIYEKRKKKNQQEEEVKTIQLAAVKENGNAITYIRNPDKDVQLAAVKENGNAITYIRNPDKDVQLAAVKENGNAIQYIRNPDKDVQLAAVKENGNAIQYIRNPDKDVQLAAVKENGNTITYIRNPDKDVQLAAAVQKNDNNYNYYHFPVPDNINFIDYSNIKVE